MIENNEFLARISLDAYLLSHYSDDIPDGRAWERAISELLWQPEFHRRQYAGQTTLFNKTSLSGCRHELDGCATGWAGCLILEGKAKYCGVDKSDVAIFHMKVFDYYLGNLVEVASEKWWLMIISAGEVTENVRRLCLQMGIILCDPKLIPLPVLLRAAAKPSTDQYLQETKLAELIRLGNRACLPIQAQWSLGESGQLCFQPQCREDIDNLLWLQEELSDDLLDLYDRYKPGVLETRSELLRRKLRQVA